MSPRILCIDTARLGGFFQGKPQAAHPRRLGHTHLDPVSFPRNPVGTFTAEKPKLAAWRRML